MTFDDIVAKPGQWLRGDGPHDKIVVSSRIRFARNLKDRPFPGWAKKAERLKILGEIQDHVAARCKNRFWSNAISSAASTPRKAPAARWSSVTTSS
jgi:protein-arginine kinase